MMPDLNLPPSVSLANLVLNLTVGLVLSLIISWYSIPSPIMG